MISRAGPLGSFGVLFTPTAMIIAQFILVTPIITGLSIAAARAVDRSVIETAISLGAKLETVLLVVNEARQALLIAVIAGFGRAIAEVGAVMIVGGDIRWSTRVLTTSIVLETRRGEFRWPSRWGSSCSRCRSPSTCSSATWASRCPIRVPRALEAKEMSFISVGDVYRTLGRQDDPQGRQPEGGKGRHPGDHRAQRRREDQPAARHRPAGPAGRRKSVHGRPGPVGRQPAGNPAFHGHGLPEAGALLHERLREHRLRDEAAEDRAARRSTTRSRTR